MRSLLLVVLGAATLSAQPRGGDVHRHDYWVGIGGGRGSLVLRCEMDCGGNPPIPRAWRGGAATGFTFTAGRTFRPDLLLGVEFGVIGEGGHDGIDENGAALMWGAFVAHHHPVARRPVFVRAGLGAGLLEMDSERYDLVSGTKTLNTSGPLVLAGVGYDIRLPKGLAFTPMAQYVVVISSGGHVSSAGEALTGPSNPGAFLATIALNWY